MEKSLDIYYTTSICIKEINEDLDKVYNRCLNASTIKMSNTIYNKALEQSKAKVFDKLGLIKPYVVYNVNRYFDFDRPFSPKYF